MDCKTSEFRVPVAAIVLLLAMVVVCVMQ